MSLRSIGVLSLLVAGFTSAPIVGYANSVFLQPGGSLNGSPIDSTSYEIAVEPGESITGSLNLRVTNSHHAGAIVPVGATVTWGNRETALWQVSSHVSQGTTNLTAPINLTAPSNPGTYYLVVANLGECRFFHVMSATNWALPQSGSSCGGAESVPRWHDGNDLGWDWTAAQLQQARDAGQVTQLLLLPRTGAYVNATYGATWVRINVEGPPPVEIINIDAFSHRISSPLSIALEAGMHTLVPINQSEGGHFTSWNTWNRGQVTGCDAEGKNCSTGWLWRYTISCPSLGEVTIPDPPIDGTNGRYSSPSLAFSSNSTVFKFTLEQQETCTFFMRDGAGQYIDNVGGVSLRLVAPSICTEHVQCDDSNGCTEDLCNVATGSCFYERANEEGTCNEGAGVCRDGECVTVLPNLADLELLTGCRPIPPCPDGAVRCDIHALNFGPGPAQELSAVMDLTNDLQVSPPVDSLAIFRGFNSTGSIGHGATPSVTPQRVEWTAPSIPAGGKAATWFTLDVGQAGGDKVVSVASGTPDPNLGNNNHIQTILPDAGRCPATDYVDKVGITARGGNQVCTNESIFYMIVFQHPPASIADVVDALDPCLDPATVSALMPEQECRVTGSTVTCAGIALDAAGMGQVSFAVKPRLSCPVGTTIPNEVVVTFDNGTELRDRTVHELGCGTGPCGNGIVEPDLEEQCEPPGTATCDAACVLTCGNGVTEPELGEECDDGNNDDDDRCSALCKLENERPVCTNAFATPDALWPPNHRLVPISVAGVADPDGDPVSITVLSVHQDEPVNGLGDGSTSPDGGGVGTDTALVRGERAGNPNVPGDGRVYTIRFDADDSKGGVCEGAVTVCVPHDQRTGSECIDGGPIFDSALW